MRRARRRCFPRFARAIKFEVSSTVMMSAELARRPRRREPLAKPDRRDSDDGCSRVIPGESLQCPAFVRTCILYVCRSRYRRGSRVISASNCSRLARSRRRRRS